MSNKVTKPKAKSKKKGLGKILKKSTDKLKKSLSAFTNKNHENQYETLDELHEEENKNPVIVLDSEEEQVSDKAEPVSGSEPASSKEPVNELENNEDFISLKFSDDEDEDDDEVLSNDEDQYSMDDNESYINNGPIVKSDVPWVQNHDHSTQKEISDWLTMEIKDFVAYISPSKEEIELRNQCFRRLKTAIEGYWRDSEVHVFGSYSTDLYLPGSDIDMVIISPNGQKYDNRSSLYSLSSFLKREGLAEKVEVIAKAKVPIIKFVESVSKIHIDVSFERTNGITAAKTIRTWLNETAGLREIVLIIKQFLNARRLNDVHTGGLGGYSIICLVYSFLTLHPRLSTGTIDAMENLGVLLIEFFELYGRNFGYDKVGISVDYDNVGYFNKNYYPNLLGRSPLTLVIRDPDDESNNISRSSFNIVNIRKAFNGAFQLLTNSCYELEMSTYKQRLGKSILGDIIKYRGTERNFEDERSLVINEAILQNDSSDGQSYIDRVYTEDEDEDDGYDIEESAPILKKAKSMNLASIATKVGKTSKKESGGAGAGKSVEDFMSLEGDDEDDNGKQAKARKRASSIDKSTRRDYWIQKGNLG